MKILKVYDSQNYTDDMPVFEKYSVRGVIVRDGKIATQMGAAGDYKILGGGVEPGEDFSDALLREVQEESGLLIKKETIREVGEILEMREDIFTKGLKYVCHSCFYLCDAREELGETHMTESEIAKGYHLVWATPEEIIAGNRAFMDEPWIRRDTEFIEMIREEI
jgi:8-oxo-dGTP pyrophosphatase MutT (NUDIX family)